MAINKNHEFEELDGIKCGIVERNITRQRADFLKSILEENGYTVVIAKAAPPKTAKSAVTDAVMKPSENTEANVPELLTIGVTDVTFNPVNAIFGRLLHTHGNKVVTLSYWNQKETEPDDSEPYFKMHQPY
ncbi:MAG: hypothetical protein JNL47_10955 [Bacteroidia bacterium]|nr:hypothetical protein [Bacteroidia bacterium]